MWPIGRYTAEPHLAGRAAAVAAGVGGDVRTGKLHITGACHTWCMLINVCSNYPWPCDAPATTTVACVTPRVYIVKSVPGGGVIVACAAGFAAKCRLKKHTLFWVFGVRIAPCWTCCTCRKCRKCCKCANMLHVLHHI
jgi:hypothetical protein